jgi:hypothetical protein
MGVEDKSNHKPGEQTSVLRQDSLVQPSAPQQDGEERTEGRSRAVPVTVVTQEQLEELQQQLAATQAQLSAAEAKLSRQREKKNAKQQRWRDRHRDHVNRYASELRARKRDSP